MIEQDIKYNSTQFLWLPKIPENWLVHKFNRVAFYQEGPGLRNWQFTEDGIKVICVTNITEKGIDFSLLTRNISMEEYEKIYKHFTVQKGDYLLASSGASWGKVAEYNSDETVILNTSTIRINTLDESIINREFLYWLIKSPYVSEQLNLLLTGSCQPNFGPTHLSQLYVALPKSIDDQFKIATFLKKKTSEIDKIVYKKEQLIQNLKEERIALVNQIVTKGSNDKIELKTSGVIWIGDIPKHWQMKKIKHLLQEKKAALKGGPFGTQLKTSDYVSSGEDIVKVYTQRNIIDKDFASGDDFVTADKFKDLEAYEAYPNDLLVTTRGTIGKCAIMPNDAERGIMHPCLIRIQLDENKVLTKWVENYFNETSYFLENVKMESNSTIMDVIYGYTLSEIALPIPPVEEQIQLLKLIDAEKSRIDNLLAKIHKEIELIKEYKSSIINEYITGNTILN